MDFEFRIKGKVHKVGVEYENGLYKVRYGNSEWNVEFSSSTDNLFTVRIGSKMHRVYLVESEGKKYISVRGQQFCVERCETRARALEPSSPSEASHICPPMPGMVVKINVSEGELVRKNQSLAIVEAMKMENELRAPMNGKVKKIHASTGDLIDADKPIIELEAN